jgi:NAD(P)-dependent dehydrogenase (short-subunit alcohol dehydrogenase family)
MRVDLTDKVALVTGSAHRVGRAIALELARMGVHIMVHYASSDETQVRDTMHEIKSHGVDAFSIRADLSTLEGVEETFAAVREHFPQLDILVNSASIFQQKQLLEVTLADWRTTMDINLTAPFLCTQYAAQMMQKQNPPGGTIINILDRGAIEPWARFAHHGISKAGLWMLTQVSAISLGPTIRTNAVLPGPVLKPPGDSDEAWEAIGKRSPLQRTGTAEDVGRAVVYLASEDYLNGTLIHVNAGDHLV